METYFPDEFKLAISNSFWQKQKEKIVNDLRMIIEDIDLTDNQNKINKYFSRQIKPKDFMSEQSDEVKHERAFEKNCVILSEYTNKPVREMNTKEYFTVLAIHNERIRHGRQSHKTR